MVSYRIIRTKQAEKDIKRLKAAGLSSKAKLLVDLLAENPYQSPPPFEKLTGNLQGTFSRRINIQHRLIYLVNDENKTVKLLRLWTHYE